MRGRSRLERLSVTQEAAGSNAVALARIGRDTDIELPFEIRAAPITGYLKPGCADRPPLAFHAYFLHAVRRPKTSRRHGEGWISDEI